VLNLVSAQLIGITLSALGLGSFALLSFARREGFFGYYFAYAPASGRGSARGKWSRQ
jgi:hypothetical protein